MHHTLGMQVPDRRGDLQENMGCFLLAEFFVLYKLIEKLMSSAELGDNEVMRGTLENLEDF